MAQQKKSEKNGSTPKGSGAKAKASGGAAGADQGDNTDYILTEKRRAELEKDAASLGADVLPFPGRSRDRVRWFHRIQLAAKRDSADLVRTPFFNEAPLTLAEIEAYRDQIEFFRAAESDFQHRRSGQATASKDFAALSEEAEEHKDSLLRAFDLRFRADTEGQKRLSQIRAGAGDADLVQDVSDLSLMAKQQMDYLVACPKGEGAAAKRLIELSPKLAQLLGAKTLSEDARAARRQRDAAYTLSTNTERRIRAAAEYWYGGTEKMKDYAAYVAPAGAPEEAEPTEAAPPAANDKANTTGKSGDA